ncbi:MAG: lipid-A-disaccharide synthase [Bacteroidota bacterium]
MVSRVMLIAGEPSGDLHGAGLVHELKKRKPDLEVYGVGGDGMKGAGMELIFHIRNLSFMGFAEVLKHLPTIRKVRQALLDVVASRKPDVLILIDYPGFNLRFARKVKAHGIRIFYYISPQVWAWGKRRVPGMKGVIDKMFVVFPFEVDIYRQAGIDVEFVGHPLLEAVGNLERGDGFRERFGISKGKKLLALLPGSRVQEVERILPVMAEAAWVLKNELQCEVAVGVAPNLKEDLYRQLLGSSASFHLVSGATYDLMRNSEIAFVTSGTATLETACFGTPMIVVYRTSFPTYWIGRMLITLKTIALVNIVAGRQIVPELIQGKMTPQNLVHEARRILRDAAVAQHMRTELLAVRGKLGTPGASARVADQVLQA